jgi:hypothetical protein
MTKEDFEINYELIPYEGIVESNDSDFDKIIFDLDEEIDLLSSQADKLDYLIAIASGLTCALLDILWVGEFDLNQGREIASDKVDSFVKKIAEIVEGKKFENLNDAVKSLEKRFPIPSDGNTPDFGGGLQHHLRDFAHHPTLVGLACSILTQFTEKSYGTNEIGLFKVVDIPEKSKLAIGKTIPEKIFFGTITWFFHLVSDIAGSSGTAGISGGTGIPGPILSLAKEISVIPLFKNLNVDDMSVNKFISKLFNGTLFMQRDDAGNIIKESIIKFDFRGELGLLLELGKQAIPVIANECMVRSFYFIRRLAIAMKENNIRTINDMKKIDWKVVKPSNNPTINRMLTISTGVFSAIDIGEAILTKKDFLAVNLVGIGRFAIAIYSDVSWGLKARKVKKIQEAYKKINKQTYRNVTVDTFTKEGSKMNPLGLSMEQTEILYNIEYYKVLNDIESTNIPIGKENIKKLKNEWLQEWKKNISDGFESFTQVFSAKIHWYSMEELQERIYTLNPSKTWYRLILLEALLFEPYYTLRIEKDRKGNDIPSQKYKDLNNFINGFKKSEGERFLNNNFTGKYCEQEYVTRLQKNYTSQMNKLSGSYKRIFSLSISAFIAVAITITANFAAGPIAVALVGSEFVGLHGAALTSACLAYIGGGAIAAGGAGMAGGTITIVGGGAILGIGLGTVVGGAVDSIEVLDKQNIILQTAKQLTSMNEIFLNDDHNIEYAKEMYEQYVNSITEIEYGLVKWRLKKDDAIGKEKKSFEKMIQKTEESVKVMKFASEIMLKSIRSFEEGL